MEDTNIPDPEALDALLREHLRAELDPQLGRATRRFHQHLRGHDPARGASSPARSTRGGWLVGIGGGAMAASIAALWAGPALWHAAPPGPGAGPRPGGAPVVPVADYRFALDDVTLLSQTRDTGTVLLDGRTPARRIVRNELKQVRWVDPDNNVSFERIEPHQDVMLIEMDTY